ncbi:MAG: ABC transporter substrate-binding protein [bacterium]
MKKNYLIILVVAVLVIVGIAFASKSSDKTKATPIRIGWSVVWVPEAELIETMQHTDVLAQNGLQAKFEKFTAGPPLAEAALAGDLDVVLMGHVPAMSLNTKDSNWNIVGRLLDGRWSIIVPKDSSIKTPNDLKGKVYATPFNTLPHILGLDMLKGLGIDPQKDLTVQNIDAVEAVNVLQKGDSKTWGNISALGLWDPTVAQFEEQGKAKSIYDGRLDGVIVMSKKFYDAHPDAAKQFMKAMGQSYEFYLTNKDLTNDWYIKDIGISYSKSVLEKAASLERNNSAKNLSEISLDLNASDIQRIQGEANIGFAVGVLKKQLNVVDIINQSFVQQAEKDISLGNYPKTINIVK